MKLHLVRHPRPLAPAGCCYGASDLPADAAHTAQVARRLARTLPRDAQGAYSPLQRCAVLATALADLRPDLRLAPDARLREMDFGAWEGQAWDRIARQELDAWTADFTGYRPGGGDSVAMVLERVRQALADARRQAQASGRAPVWITHAGVMRAALLLARGPARALQATQWPRRALAFGGSFALDLARFA